MNIIATAIPELKIIEPRVFGDERGFFFESFNETLFESAVGRKVDFPQDNHSKSQKGVLRGLHYQLVPAEQGKLVRVIRGSVFDVAVDIRKSSPTFGKWVGLVLSEKNKKQLWIPPGFAHGFLTLEDNTEFVYKTTNFYAPEFERCIAWDDPSINIDWPKIDSSILLSEKDKCGEKLENAEVFE